MTDARDAILGRVRAALRDVPAGERPGDVPVARDYRCADTASTAVELAQTFEQRLAEYGAQVVRCSPADLPGQIARTCKRRRLRRVAAADGLPEDWRPADPELRPESDIAIAELDRLDAALTGCAVAVADTGTIVLDGGPRCGRRALTLVPDTHLCVVERRQLVAIVPEAIREIAGDRARRLRPLTFISGPSATSDIELARVDGVHGPRNLVVFIVG